MRAVLQSSRTGVHCRCEATVSGPRSGLRSPMKPPAMVVGDASTR